MVIGIGISIYLVILVLHVIDAHRHHIRDVIIRDVNSIIDNCEYGICINPNDLDIKSICPQKEIKKLIHGHKPFSYFGFRLGSSYDSSTVQKYVGPVNESMCHEITRKRIFTPVFMKNVDGVAKCIVNLEGDVEQMFESNICYKSSREPNSCREYFGKDDTNKIGEYSCRQTYKHLYLLTYTRPTNASEHVLDIDEFRIPFTCSCRCKTCLKTDKDCNTLT